MTNLPVQSLSSQSGYAKCAASYGGGSVDLLENEDDFFESFDLGEEDR